MRKAVPSDRSDFLREFYRLLTDDIRRSEAVVPKVIGLQIVAMVVLIAAQWAHGPMLLSSLLVLLTSSWAMHMIMNANLWARRSHLMATNVELEFFAPDDMDVLLPASYYSEARRYRYRRIFRVALLVSLAFFLVGLACVPLRPEPKSLATFALGILLLAAAYIENRNCGREYRYLSAHSPGRGRGGSI